jgi:branched-chain amino acid transport system permease protein
MVLGVATIAIGQALSMIASNIPAIGGSLGYSGVSLETTINWVALFLVIALLVFTFLRRTHLGLALLAVGKEPAVAEALGISSTFVRVWAFAFGGVLTGLAGALQAHWLSVVEPTDLGFANEALIFMYLIVGGLSSPWGAALGAIGINWLLEALKFTGSDRFWILGILLVVVVLSRPQGIIPRRNLPAERKSLLHRKPRAPSLPVGVSIGD